jgi:DNA-binding NtrC family response regulator
MFIPQSSIVSPVPPAVPGGYFLPYDTAAGSSLQMSEMIGESAAMGRLRTQVRRLGPHFRTVLLRGEAGTGKELVARALHGFSSHASGPFAVFRCAMSDVDETLADGRMAQALKGSHRGTLYFDKVCGLSAIEQGGLLEALRRRDRARGPILIHGLEARIIASTGEDLRIRVATGRFHEELYRRLATVEIELPALRDRTDDIEALAEYFLCRHTGLSSRQIEKLSTEALERMRGYAWPGNVEELEQRVRSALLGTHGESFELARPLLAAEKVEAVVPARLHEVVEQHVFQVLKDCLGNKVKAAEVLGISRSTLYRMLDAGVLAARAERAR